MSSQVPTGYKQTEVGIIPEDWAACSIQDLVLEGILEKPLDGNHGNIHPKSSDFVYSGIPFVMSNNVQNGIIDLKDCHFIRREQADRLQKGFSFEGDILLTHKGTVGNVAIVCKIDTDYLMLTPQVTYYRVKDNRRLKNTFIKFYFESSGFQSTLEQRSGGGTRAYIGIVSQLKLPFVLPPLPEQQAIASTLSDIDNLLASLDQLIAKKRDLKQATMQQLLTGKKRLPGFSETKEYKKTEAGEIPADWNIFTIGETATLINGRAFKPSDWSTSGAPIIRIQNLNDPMATYNYYEGDVESRYYVELGDLLFAWSGTKESSFGARVWHGEKAILNQHIFRVVPDTKKLSSQYLFLALKRFQEEIEKKSHGFKSSFVHIKKLDLENTYLAVPSIPEQTAIAEILSDIDTELTTLQTRRTKTQALKQATMQQLLTGQTRLI